MRFWTLEEAKLWSPSIEFASGPWVDSQSDRFAHRVRAQYGDVPWSRLRGLIYRAIDAVGPRNWWMVWMDEGPGQWSGGNPHLYYRVRQSYQDFRLLHEAPCHLFLQHELADVLTFVEIAMTNLWDVRVVTDLKYGRLLVSYSEWLEVSSTEDLQSLRASLNKDGIRIDD